MSECINKLTLLKWQRLERTEKLLKYGDIIIGKLTKYL